jgi:hypothetical protein
MTPHRDAALTPEEIDILDEFRADLQRVREQGTEKLRLALYKLEVIHDGLAELNADTRGGRLQ